MPSLRQVIAAELESKVIQDWKFNKPNDKPKNFPLIDLINQQLKDKNVSDFDKHESSYLDISMIRQQPVLSDFDMHESSNLDTSMTDQQPKEKGVLSDIENSDLDITNQQLKERGVFSDCDMHEGSDLDISKNIALQELLPIKDTYDYIVTEFKSLSREQFQGAPQFCYEATSEHY